MNRTVAQRSLPPAPRALKRSGAKPNKRGKKRNGQRRKPDVTTKVKTIGLLDATRTVHFARPLHVATPYTVIRHKVVHTYTPGDNAKGYAVFGSFDQIGDDTMSPTFGVVNEWTRGWFDPLTRFDVPQLLANGNKKARLHRMTVHVQSMGAPNQQFMPKGMVGIATMRGGFDFSDSQKDAQTISDYLFTRNELRTATAYAASLQPLTASVAPLDYITYDEFKHVAKIASFANSSIGDQVAPVVVAWQALPSGQSLVFSVHTEYTVIYLEDSVLQSTGSLHPPASHESWLSETAEIIGGMAATSYASLRNAGVAGVRVAPRALPALMM